MLQKIERRSGQNELSPYIGKHSRRCSCGITTAKEDNGVQPRERSMILLV